MVKGILINRRSDDAIKSQLKMEHADLVAEMQAVEGLPTHERLQLARLRRAQQLKSARQKEKEWMKLQRAKGSSLLTLGGNYNGVGNDSGGGVGFTSSNTTHHFRTSVSSGGSGSGGPRHISFENSVVLLEAASRNDIQEVAELLKHGITPDAANEDGLTALHQCCIDNNVEMLRLLLQFGANVDAQDSDKWTPLHAAATCGHLELVRILIDRGANLLAVNTDGNMPYDLCDDENTLDYIEAEMSKRGVTQELIDDTRSSTERQMLKDLMELARTGGDLEDPDKQGATPLHIAAANGYVRVVEFLLELHVNVDALDKDMWSPVHAAACWGHMEVLELLAQFGADLYVRNKDDETPADICEDPEIRERIEQLKTEQESKRLAEAQRRRVRRSQSNNTRAQSVRRTSLRDKTLTTKKDAVEEARLRLQAQEVFQTPGSTTLDTNGSMPGAQFINGGSVSSHRNSLTASDFAAAIIADEVSHTKNNGVGTSSWLSWKQNSANNNNNSAKTHHTNNNNEKKPVPSQTGTFLPHSISADAVDSGTSTNTTNSFLSRRPPDGRENDELQMTSYKTGIYEHQRSNSSCSSSAATTAVLASGGVVEGDNDERQKSAAELVHVKSSKEAANGKINVQVTVLVDTISTHQHHHHSQQQQQQQTPNVIVEPAFGGATLANLKKQRSLSRNNVLNVYENGSVLGAASNTTPTTTTANLNHNKNNINNNLLSDDQQQQQLQLHNHSPTAIVSIQPLSSGIGGSLPDDLPAFSSVNKFSGVTGDVVSDSTSSKKCCLIM